MPLAVRLATTSCETPRAPLPVRSPNPSRYRALSSIGYREFVGVVQGEVDRAEALRLMQRDTLRYARRQRTWFAREPALAWLDVDAFDGNAAAVAAAIEARLKQEGHIE